MRCVNERGETVVDVLTVGGLFVLLVVPFAVFGLWWWVVMMLAITAVFGVFELAAKLKTGKTLSQMFWNWSTAEDVYGHRKNAWKAWLVVACLVIGWFLLMAHLIWRVVGG